MKIKKKKSIKYYFVKNIYREQNTNSLESVLFKNNETGLIPKITKFGQTFTKYLKDTIDKNILPTFIGGKIQDNNNQSNFEIVGDTRKRKRFEKEIETLPNKFEKMTYDQL